MTKWLNIHKNKNLISSISGDWNSDHKAPDNDNDFPPALPICMEKALPAFGSRSLGDGLWHLA